MKSTLHKSTSAWVRLLSSMDLAITLLVMLAIASVIGTIVQQNQPYRDYAIKFGPFWFEVFEVLGLFNVYNELWFLSVLAFLVLSICFCLWRHTPTLLKDIKSLPAQQTWQQLRHGKHVHLQPYAHNMEAIEEKLQQDGRYRLSAIRTYHLHTEEQASEYAQITAKQGRGQKLGYLFTHIGVVVICLGALLDSSIALKIDQWLGNLEYETENIPLSEIDEKSFLPPTNRTFRGSVSIPEGKSSGVAFLPWAEGYLVQQLPFIIDVKDFRTIHYPTGQPSSFETDLSVHERTGEFITSATIDVNTPLSVRDVSIYQSSFEDGGSVLDLSMRSFDTDRIDSFRLNVYETRELTIQEQKLTLELDDFRLYNIQPLEHNPHKFKNQGPSFHYKLRSPTGIATEYENYMVPMEKDGQYFLISGIRNTPQEPFKYLYIPLDDTFSSARFFSFMHWLKDEDSVREILANSTLIKDNFPPEMTLDVQLKMIENFMQQGANSINDLVETINDPAQQEQMSKVFLDLLHLMLSEIYVALIAEENRTKPTPNTSPSSAISEQQARFYQDSVKALSAVHEYRHSVFLILDDYKHIQASGLQLTKAPGQMWVYLGCLLLVIGIFCMFYLPISRVWISLKEGQLLIAVDSMKNNSDHQEEIQRLVKLLS